MKFDITMNRRSDDEVAPLAGAWIEILADFLSCAHDTVAPLAGAWIEIECYCNRNSKRTVAPLAGAWIEIFPLIL